MHRSAEGSFLEQGELTAQDRHVDQGDTIAAISTPAGEGAIALVRMSGENAITMAEKIFRGKGQPSQFTPQLQHFGEIVDQAGTLVDQVMMSIHRAPISYTGEDLVEISCHGGVLVTARVLETCLRAGARAARGGEFTERAFLNGKMDLTQAEAVIDLIRAKSDLALRSATEQLEGRLGREIKQIREEIISLLAHINASLDFSEEGIEPDEGDKLIARLDAARDKMSILLATAHQGRVLREGVRVVIYGATNAGKSSLLNCMLGYERVIVSETHGTTRDTIEETINLRGIPIRLLDTAGLRAASDAIEQEGIARTKTSLQNADLCLHVVDGSEPNPLDCDDERPLNDDIMVINKCDLSVHADWQSVEAVRISCVTGDGLPQLEEEILARISKQNLQPESTVAINARHHDCLRRALEASDRARAAMNDGMSPEYVAADLNEALRGLGEILGEVDVEAILDSVFRQFCIGK
ncbi:MAG: tRNA uridine-5-carboxymethylaminomethyl(34) synthesis GTPase MnmE [Spartobacteria bacterium]